MGMGSRRMGRRAEAVGHSRHSGSGLLGVVLVEGTKKSESLTPSFRPTGNSVPVWFIVGARQPVPMGGSVWMSERVKAILLIVGVGTGCPAVFYLFGFYVWSLVSLGFIPFA